jgi:hypothetical protein
VTNRPTLTDFLLARIAEDLSTAAATSALRAETYAASRRVLAECEAKRRIVERCTPLSDMQVRRQTRTLASDVLCALASVYADHADYRESWRP